MLKTEVWHPQYGRGVVEQTRHKGFELRVTFEDGLARWVRLDEVMGTEITPLKPAELPSAPVFSDERLKSRRMIEAFRLGIVPYDCVEDFTFGRDEETEKIMNWLNSSEDNTLLIIGEYGTGKTHLLHYALGRALQGGFAVAWVEMDPNEVPFHKPKRVYSHLIQNFKYRSQQQGQLLGFRDFLKEVLAKGAFKDHIYFMHLIGKTSDETLWDWIEAQEPYPRPWDYPYYLPGLYDHSTAANIYCYLLSALGWAAQKLLKLKGLLLVFDEAETLDMYYYLYQVNRSLNFLEALTSTADNSKRLLAKPKESGLSYCCVGIGPEVPFMYKSPSGLKLLFAFTPSVRKYLAEDTDLQTLELGPLTEDALKEAFEHICLLYDSAYNFLEGDMTIDTIFRKVNIQSGYTRLFIKASVEALDLVRFNYGKPLDEVLQ